MSVHKTKDGDAYVDVGQFHWKDFAEHEQPFRHALPKANLCILLRRVSRLVRYSYSSITLIWHGSFNPAHWDVGRDPGSRERIDLRRGLLRDR